MARKFEGKDIRANITRGFAWAIGWKHKRGKCSSQEKQELRKPPSRRASIISRVSRRTLRHRRSLEEGVAVPINYSEIENGHLVDPRTSSSVLDLVGKHRTNRHQKAPCVCCLEQISALTAGEHVIRFERCDHSAHEDCWNFYKEEALQNESRRAQYSRNIGDCPACEFKKRQQQMNWDDTKSLPDPPTRGSSTTYTKEYDDRSDQASILSAASTIRTSQTRRRDDPIERKHRQPPSLRTLPENHDVPFDVPMLALKIPRPMMAFLPELESIDTLESGMCIMSILVSIIAPKKLAHRPQAALENGYSHMKVSRDGRDSPSTVYSTKGTLPPDSPSLNNFEHDARVQEMLDSIDTIPGLDINNIGELKHCASLKIGLEADSKTFECCLFDEVMVCLKASEFRSRSSRHRKVRL